MSSRKFSALPSVKSSKRSISTGGSLLGRNLDYPSRGYAHEHSLVTVYRPRGCKAFVSVGFPGLMGCLSGMNDAGLTVAVLEVWHRRADEAEAVPVREPSGLVGARGGV